MNLSAHASLQIGKKKNRSTLVGTLKKAYMTTIQCKLQFSVRSPIFAK